MKAFGMQDAVASFWALVLGGFPFCCLLTSLAVTAGFDAEARLHRLHRPKPLLSVPPPAA